MESRTDIGILGGGQLGSMLGAAARDLGLTYSVFATSPDDPAIAGSSIHTVSSFDNTASLAAFLNRSPVVIYENEFIPEQVLNEAASRCSNTQLRPKPSTMAWCADKLAQKQRFNQLGLATARFAAGSPDEPAHQMLQRFRAEFPNGCVIKWAKGGYDGGGVQIVRSEAGWQDALPFIQSAQAAASHLYAEELIRFDKEMALVAIRTLTGEFRAYPLVDTVQINQICTSVVGPAELDLQVDAEAAARVLAESVDLVGVFAIEFFKANGHLWINEMAPRVHNSGHVTMDAAESSQFDNHLRAVLGMPIGSMRMKPYYGMINILGPKSYSGPLAAPSLAGDCMRVHWYHKAQSRPGRKIGHLNVWVDQPDISLFGRRMSEYEEALSQWSVAVAKGEV